MADLPPITSLQNPRVKAAARLRDARQRRKQGRLLIDGAREIARAMAAGVPLVEVFACPELCQPPESDGLLEGLAGADCPVWTVAEPVLEKLAFGNRREGLVAVAEEPAHALADFAPRGPDAQPLIAVLERVEKPGNVGAVLRSADAAGLSGLILADPATDLYNPNAIRASLGTIFTVPVCTADSRETLDWLAARQVAVVAARVDASVPYTEVDFRRPTAIVLGSEAEGLSDVFSGPEVTAVRLPMRGVADSLNVSVSAAVLFYEALRQRQQPQ